MNRADRRPLIEPEWNVNFFHISLYKDSDVTFNRTRMECK